MTDPQPTPDLAADLDDDVEAHAGPPADEDDLEVAIDVMVAGDEDDLDGDGLPDPPDHEEL